MPRIHQEELETRDDPTSDRHRDHFRKPGK
ncbi:hypothetical protein P3T25_002320 [Paraburkholderia sp. GAS32]